MKSVQPNPSQYWRLSGVEDEFEHRLNAIQFSPPASTECSTALSLTNYNVNGFMWFTADILYRKKSQPYLKNRAVHDASLLELADIEENLEADCHHYLINYLGASIKVNNEIELTSNLSALPSGVYISVSNCNGSVTAKKVVKL